MYKPFTRILPSLLLGGIVTAHAEQAARPNIVFILTDDLGYGDLGVFYQNARRAENNSAKPSMLTPNIDKLAGDGLRLDRHYCPAPVSAPSRASLLTGVHQGHANVRNNQFDKALSDNHTLASVLKQAGYATANIGKWGLHGNNTTFPAHPMRRGFDYFFGYMEHGDAHYHYPKETNTQAPSLNINFYDGYTDIREQMDGCYSTDVITARTKKWIVDQRSADPTKPFFIYLAYTAPHARLDVPTQAYPAGGGLSGGMQWLGTPGNLINTAGGTANSWIHPDYATAVYNGLTAWPAAAKRHATMIRRVDDAVADLRQLLVDLNISDNTLIVFSSDNGPHAESGTGGSYAQNPQFFRSYGPMDGIKRDVWEAGVRVPTIAAWPAKIPAGSTTNKPAQFHDWMPTFAELAGLPIPERSDGVSLVPTLTGDGEQRDGIVYSEYDGGGAATPGYTDFYSAHRGRSGDRQMIFIGKYKAIRYGISSNTTSFEIYDTLTDPQETTNLAGQSDVPTQTEIEARVLQIRRADSNAGRTYDSAQIPAIVAPQVVSGLDYRTYAKTTPWVPNWETETPVTSGETTTPAAGVSLAPTTDGGALITGFINVPADGSYTFYLTTDSSNGAFVRIHDAQLIDADYGYTAGAEVSSGTIPLKAGKHPIAIHYRHAAGATHSLVLKWESSGIAKTEIPATAYFRSDVPVLTANNDTFSFANNDGAPVTLLPLDNDLGVNFSITSITQPNAGNASISPDGKTIIYTPQIGFFGKVFFNYTITDGEDEKTAKITADIARPITGGLLWLPLDESTGAISYDAGGNSVGVVNGCTRIAGMRGGAYQFNGTTDEIVISKNNFSPPTGSSARTITAWLKPATTQPESSTWLGYGTNNNGTRFSLRTENGKLRCEVQSGSVVGTKTLADGQWHHVAIVVPAGATNVSNVVFYIDGELDAKSATTAQTLNTAGDNAIVIGGSPHSALYHYAGGIDDVRIYSQALSLPEILEIKNRASAGMPSVADNWFYRTTGNVAPTEADWQSDTNNDGLSALAEFVLGGNPASNNTNVMPAICKKNTDTLPEVYFVYNRRHDLSASVYTVEISETLKSDSWQTYDTTGNEITEPHPENSDYDVVRVKLPEPSPGNKGVFARLRVSL